jgi:hypothetical protein
MVVGFCRSDSWIKDEITFESTISESKNLWRTDPGFSEEFPKTFWVMFW